MTPDRALPGARRRWDEVYLRPAGLSQMLRWANAHVPLVELLLDAESVLEVGTGTASLSTIVSRWADRVVSLDVSEGVLSSGRASTRQLRGRVAFVRSDAFSMPFGPGCFDVAFSQGLLEHFDDDSILALIAEQQRVARRVLASVPGAAYPHVGSRGPGLVGNERLLSARRWRRLVAPIGGVVTSYRDPKVLQIAGAALAPRFHLLIDVPGR
jgi:hypothetical protein